VEVSSRVIRHAGSTQRLFVTRLYAAKEGGNDRYGIA
jgi:hypothetical protein